MSLRLVGSAFLGLFAVTVVMKLVTEDGSHPLLPVLAATAGAGAAYLLVEAIRHWYRPR